MKLLSKMYVAGFGLLLSYSFLDNIRWAEYKNLHGCQVLGETDGIHKGILGNTPEEPKTVWKCDNGRMER